MNGGLELAIISLRICWFIYNQQLGCVPSEQRQDTSCALAVGIITPLPVLYVVSTLVSVHG